VDLVPRELGKQAAAGEVTAGLLPLADFLRLQQQFERLGRFGIGVRGRVGSVLLFSRRPVRQLDGATIAVTQETSTTAVLLRLLLEQRYRLRPAEYRRGVDPDADALLLIGDEALRERHANTKYPYEIDLAFEWWLWQHLPFVFAVWAIRKDAPQAAKRSLERSLSLSLGRNSQQLPALAAERAGALGVPADELAAYLSRFIYRLSADEEQGITKFSELVHEHHLL
jgi:chorismate dehydratase